ncbi:MAG: hypothetical protein AAF799_46085 [Myxococcota bacterium]
MHVRLSYWAIASVLIAGCGDDSTTTDTGGASSETGMSTPLTSGSDTSGGADGTSSGGGEGTSGSDGGATTNDTDSADSGDTTEGKGEESSSGGAQAMVDVTMSGLMINQDCMPIVATDPVGAGFMLELDNVGEVPATVSVVSATFIDARSSEAGTIELTPPVIGPIDPGDDTGLFMSKIADSLMPATGCSVVLCNETYDLEVVLDIEGTEVTVSDSATVACVF